MNKNLFRLVAATSAIALVSGCGTLLSSNGPDGSGSANGGGLSVAGSSQGSNGGGNGTGGAAAAGVANGATTNGSNPGAAGGGGTYNGGSGANGPNPGGSSPNANTPGSGTQSGPTGNVVSAGAGAPIKIGFVLTFESNIGSYGFSTGQTVAEQSVDQALVNAINAQGGVGGHKIQAVYAKTDTASTSWSTDFAAACSTFTQDNHVVAVLGYDFNFDTNFESCLTKAGVVHLSTAFNVPDVTTLAQYPLLWNMSVPDITSRNLAKLEGAAATGFLTPSNKLGIVTDTCPGTQESWNGVIRPWIEAHHYVIADEIASTCGTGDNASQSSAISSVPNAIVQFRSKGVDRIDFVSVSEGPALAVVADAAESQNWHPGYIVSSLANLSVLTGQVTSDQLKNVHGFGWMPSQDESPSQFAPPDAAQERCLGMLKSQGIVPQAAEDFQMAWNVCDPLFLYQDALAADAGNTTGTAVSNAIAQVNTGFQSVMLLTGRSVFTHARQNDAALVYRPADWNNGCSCFTYVGSIMDMPTP